MRDDFKERREAMRLSRHELAELAEVSYSAIASVERRAMPRGGQAIVDKIEHALGKEKGGVVQHDTVITEGDVVSVCVNDEEFLLLVTRKTETTLQGTMLVKYQASEFKAAVEAGARIYKHRGINYLRHHTRTVLREAATRHWVIDPEPVVG